jgi:hypothetical protein
MADSFYCKINNTLVSVDKDWSITTDIEYKTTFSCTVTDLETLDQIYKGDECKFYDKDDNVLFDGFVKSEEKYNPDKTNQNIYHLIQCVCWCKLSSRRLVAAVVTNDTVENIIEDEILPILVEEGVANTAAYIDCPVTITRVKFPYITCEKALNQLKDLLYGYTWYISDVTKRLYFYYTGDNVLGVTLNDTYQHTYFRQHSHMNVYRNTQYIRGGKARTSTQTNETPSPSPDGNIRTYTTRYPIAEEPTVETNLAGAGWVTKTCGVNGIDAEGTHDFYFTYNSPHVVQDSGGVILGAADDIRITYIGLRDIFIKVDEPEQIGRRLEVEDQGQSGIYENMCYEPDIDEKDQGIDFGKGLLRKYGDIADKVIFKTEQDAFRWSFGKLVKIEKDSWDINEFFYITRVTTTQKDQTHAEYTITALDGAAVGGWEQYFSNLLNRDKEYTINDSEVLVLLNSQNQRIDWKGELNIITYNDLLEVSESTLVSESTIVGGSTVSDETIYD